MNKGLGIEASETGFGNNTIHANKPPQVAGVIKLQPNACIPACPSCAFGDHGLAVWATMVENGPTLGPGSSQC